MNPLQDGSRSERDELGLSLCLWPLSAGGPEMLGWGLL